MFTDEELKQIKEQHLKLNNLIDRLEAAEYALMRLRLMSTEQTQGMKEAVEIWRQKAGKK